MLNLVARNKNHETVLILAWQRGRVLALHADGRLAEYRPSDLRADLLEATGRIAMNERQNVDLFDSVVADQG